MDICIEMMLTAPTDVELPSHLKGKFFEVGDTVSAYDAIQFGSLQGQNYIPYNLPVSIPRKCLLFVKSIPDTWGGYTITLGLINSIIEEVWNQDVLTGDGYDVNKIKDRKWNLWDGLSQGIKNNLVADRYDTINFSQLKGALRNKQTLSLLTESDIIQDLLT